MKDEDGYLSISRKASCTETYICMFPTYSLLSEPLAQATVCHGLEEAVTVCFHTDLLAGKSHVGKAQRCATSAAARPLCFNETVFAGK